VVEPLKPLSPAAGPTRVATGEDGPSAGRKVAPPSPSGTVSRLELRLVGVAGEELIVEGGGRRLLLAGEGSQLAAIRRAATVGRSTLTLLLPRGGTEPGGRGAARLVALDGEPLDLAVSLRRAPGPERAAAAGPSRSAVSDTSGPVVTAGTRRVFEATIPGAERPLARLTVVVEPIRASPAAGGPTAPATAPAQPTVASRIATPPGSGAPAPAAPPPVADPLSAAPPRPASPSPPATVSSSAGPSPPGNAASAAPAAGPPVTTGTVPPGPGAAGVPPGRPAPVAVAPTPAQASLGSPAAGAERSAVAIPTIPSPASPAVAAPAPATAGPPAAVPSGIPAMTAGSSAVSGPAAAAPSVGAGMPALAAGTRIPATVIGHDPGGRLVLRLPGGEGGAILQIEERGLDIPPGSRITLRVDRVLEAEAREVTPDRVSAAPPAPGPASATTVAMADRDAALRLFAHLLRRAAPEATERPPPAAKAEGTAPPATPPAGTPGGSGAGSVVWLGGGGAPLALRIGERSEAGTGAGEDGGRRWTFALELAAFGAMRLELWARDGSRQLAVRSERPLPEEVRRLIADTFGAALEISGNRGWLIFTGLAATMAPQEDPATRGLLA